MIEIDQLEDGHVVLAIRSIRLIVMGRTLDEARTWARLAIAYRGLSLDPHLELSMAAEEMLRPPNSNEA
jgi:hypothetical protein